MHACPAFMEMSINGSFERWIFAKAFHEKKVMRDSNGSVMKALIGIFYMQRRLCLQIQAAMWDKSLLSRPFICWKG